MFWYWNDKDIFAKFFCRKQKLMKRKFIPQIKFLTLTKQQTTTSAFCNQIRLEMEQFVQQYNGYILICEVEKASNTDN